MGILGDAINGINNAQEFLNGKDNPLTENQRNSFKQEGFLLPAGYDADGSGLPFSKVPNNRDGRIKRNIITWFVPEFGSVKMYINPQGITYSDNKIISKQQTKGGFSLQYWGEELTTLNITGTTGSSGIEGINMLYEIYRAEQLAFDGFGMTLASNNAASDIANNAVNEIGGAIGKGVSSLFGGDGGSAAAAGGAGLLGGLLGTNSPNSNLSTQNIPSLAQLAFTVEMFYNGVVYRGYFNSMSVEERANDFCFGYTINFTVTQKRGYRTNYLPFHRSPKYGYSDYNTPNSFSGKVVK